MYLLLAYLFLALFVSFVCSIMESVLLCTPQSFLIVKHEEGNVWAKKFLDLKINIDKPLSAILSLNTVAHTIGAAGVGAQAVEVFGKSSLGVVSAILTLLILVITEIIPKTVGANYWRELSKVSCRTINVMIFITYPLVLISSVITKVFSKDEKESTTSREEIAALTSIGVDEGVFTEKEHKVIQNIIRLKDVRVKEIMTPRVVVVVADENLTLAEFLKDKSHLKFSRIPVYADNDEDITGYVFRQTVLEKLAEDQDKLQLKDIKRNITMVPNTKVLFTLWDELIVKKEHIAVIVDEYGGLDGIVTMEDIIETLLGFEIVDEKDTVDDMQEYARQRWKAKQAEFNLLDKINSGKKE